MVPLAVWIVAVERHAVQAGAASPLDVASPITTPALQFAQLALERDPQAKLFINVSHPGRAEDQATLLRLTHAGAAVGDATLAALQAVPAQLSAVGAELLLIYWVGHGVMQENRRLLVTADSHSAEQLWAVEVDGLLGHLRSQAQAALQIGFFECCAQVVSVTPNRLQLAQYQPTDRRQHYFFAASAGELASDDTRRPGFTQSALAALGAIDWPPDPAALRAALDAALAKVPLQSRPTSLQWTDGSGDLWSVGGSGAAQKELAVLARRAGVSVSELAHLLDDAHPVLDGPTLSQALHDGTLDAALAALDGAYPPRTPGRLHVDLLHRAVARWRRARAVLAPAGDLALYWRDWRRLATDELTRQGRDGVPAATDLPGLLLELLDQTDAQRGMDSMIRVLEGACRRARPAQAMALRQAMQADPALASRVAAAVAELPTADRGVYLAASVALIAANSGPLIDRAWLIDGADGQRSETLPVPAADDGLAGQLNELIDTAVSRAFGRRLVIELLVPSDLLCAPRRWLEFSNALLGVQQWLECQWPIVLRWRDRLDPRTGARRFNAARWKQQAHALQAARAPGAALRCRFADTPAAAADVVALAFPGPSPADPQRNRPRFFQALLDGHPYMCWPREPVKDEAAFRARAAQLVQANTLEALAQALSVEKQGADTTLHDLLLMIDEPARNPLDGRLDEPTIAAAGR
jgi:hypothetical protein